MAEIQGEETTFDATLETGREIAVHIINWHETEPERSIPELYLEVVRSCSRVPELPLGRQLFVAKSLLIMYELTCGASTQTEVINPLFRNLLKKQLSRQLTPDLGQHLGTFYTYLVREVAKLNGCTPAEMNRKIEYHRKQRGSSTETFPETEAIREETMAIITSQAA